MNMKHDSICVNLFEIFFFSYQLNRREVDGKAKIEKGVLIDATPSAAVFLSSSHTRWHLTLASCPVSSSASLHVHRQLMITFYIAMDSTEKNPPPQKKDSRIKMNESRPTGAAAVDCQSVQKIKIINLTTSNSVAK